MLQKEDSETGVAAPPPASQPDPALDTTRYQQLNQNSPTLWNPLHVRLMRGRCSAVELCGGGDLPNWLLATRASFHTSLFLVCFALIILKYWKYCLKFEIYLKRFDDLIRLWLANPLLEPLEAHFICRHKNDPNPKILLTVSLKLECWRAYKWCHKSWCASGGQTLINSLQSRMAPGAARRASELKISMPGLPEGNSGVEVLCFDLVSEPSISKNMGNSFIRTI